MRNRKVNVRQLTLGAMLTALVVVLQLFASSILLGPTISVSLVLIPIVIGAAACGPYIGAWLGLVFGVVVLFGPDTAAFLAFNAPATVLLVLMKGILAGLAAGYVYRAVRGWNEIVAVVLAAIVCPVVNTGVFLLGCALFFKEMVAVNVMIGLIGLNFLVEMIFNLVLSPVVVRLLNIRRKQS